MRVTGGLYKGRKIMCPPGVIRPAMDRMRESLFSILGNLQGCSFLDLFSGSGVVGIEAASRGACPVVLVEMDRRKKGVIEKNMAFVETEINLYAMPAERFIRLAGKAGRRFDFTYLDPPFNKRNKEGLIRDAAKYSLPSQGGMIILHHPTAESYPEEVEGLKITDIRRYGGSTLTFYISPTD